MLAGLGAILLLNACAPNTLPATTPGTTPSPILTSMAPTALPSPLSTAPARPTPASTPALTVPTPTETELYPAAVQAARATAARDFNEPPASVTVVSFTPVDWRNGCLEVDRMERPCTDAIVPGYQVMLSVAGQNYEYRTNLDGSQVVFAGPDVVQSPSVPAAVVFTWHREGGIAGVCDELRVLATGEVVASNCRRGVSDEVGRSTLTPAEDDQLDAWLAAYAPINATFKDAAVADALTQTLALAGRGTTQPTADEEQAMLDLASTVYARIASDVLR
jgi:hypothetical protein